MTNEATRETREPSSDVASRLHYLTECYRLEPYVKEALDDARAELLRLRSENAELRQSRDEIRQSTARRYDQLEAEIDRYRAVLVELVAAQDHANSDAPRQIVGGVSDAFHRLIDAWEAARALTTAAPEGPKP